ncbi:MAG: discoidin domain-containing protein [Cellulomonas sp.]|nr:discoidin domain-containing protein [Cellulomonas sp.]NMM31688.1 discoidin domain-containing protein [Cellulomonas sp.]
MHTQPRARLRWAALLTSMAVSVALAPAAGAAAATPTLTPAVGVVAAAATLLSQGKTATASSTENAGTPASAAVDGNSGTRWSSQFSDPQWIQVDLGQQSTLTSLTLQWEAAYGKAFTVKGSDDAATWATLATVTNGTGGNQTINLTGSARYVRLDLTARATAYGYSLWELQVYGSTATPPPGCSTTNAAQGSPVAASSALGGNTAAMAVDGNTGTRWESVQGVDPQWIYVDLGSTQSICQVVLNWETAAAKSFTIDTATSPSGPWTSIYTTTAGTGGVQTLAVSGTARYVRMNGTARTTPYGYSLWELQVFTGSTGGGVCPTYSDNPDFGPNVHIYSHAMTDGAIQASLDDIFNAQKDTQTAQFQSRRDAEVFLPSATPYNVYANIGFNTSILGVGQNPDDVRINGAVTVDAFNASDAGNATQNFWRSAENLSINTNGGRDRWAVAQAAPFRRIHVVGGLDLFPASYGWASGGYISDTKVDGSVASASQQQWYSKDSSFGSWNGSNWNMVFSGVSGAPAQSFPAPPMTTLATTPVSRDVPYLYVDAAGKYRVFLPDLRTNASGTSWPNTPGTSVPMSSFFVARPTDSAATINTALANGCNVFFTPGIYHVSEMLHVQKANTVVLGIGYPTIIPDNGVNAMDVANVDGVRIKGMFFDAGTTNSNALLTVGTAGSQGTGHASNPTTIQDVFFRIGGAFAGKATNSLVVNASNAIIDHTWAWRADHGAGVGWTSNTADTGIIVNGDNVLGEGLFVEHYQKSEIVWNGQGGKVIFLQNEMPYDVPTAAAGWTYQGHVGYPALEVANGVTSFEGWGLGSYCNFTTDKSIAAYHAFQTPVNANVKWHDMATVSLGGAGSIVHVINDTGATAQGTATVPVNVVAFP